MQLQIDRLVNTGERDGVNVMNSLTYPVIYPYICLCNHPANKHVHQFIQLSMYPGMHSFFNSSPCRLTGPPMKQAILHFNYQCIRVPSHLCTHPFNQPTSYLPTNQLAATFVLPPVRGGGWKLALVSGLVDR